MEKLQRVQQLDKHGCSIACLAMIVGKSYFQVRAILHETTEKLLNKFVLPENIGLHCRDLYEALNQTFDVSCKFIKFVSLTKLTKHCILYVCPLAGCYDYIHSVIFDAERHCIIDPFEDKNFDINEYNVICCIEVQK